jgi:hypothetical protein
MYTKKHMESAAKIVKHILLGKWTNDPPEWANHCHMTITVPCNEDAYTRAVQTAEVFIILFQGSKALEQRFDAKRFLTTCGLKDEAKVYKVIDRLK